MGSVTGTKSFNIATSYPEVYASSNPQFFAYNYGGGFANGVIDGWGAHSCSLGGVSISYSNETLTVTSPYMECTRPDPDSGRQLSGGRSAVPVNVMCIY